MIMDLIQISKILYLIGMFIWILPAIRQRRTNFSYFFLVLAIGDPINYISYSLIGINPANSIFLYMSYIMLISILEKRVIKKHFVIFVIPFLFMITTNLFTDIMDGNALKLAFILIHSLIFSLILKQYAFNQSEKGTINWFFLVLLFYELTVIFKFVGVTFEFINAAGYFIFTTLFQIAFGLFFSVFRADDQRIVSKLR